MNALVTDLKKSGGKDPAGPRWRVVSSTLPVAILSFISCSLASAQTSVYHPFPDSNAVWGMVSGCSDMVLQCGNSIYIQNYFAGDTSIEGNTYKVVHEVVSQDAGGCCGPPEDLGPGFLRDDTVARKVYWRIPGMDADTLLFDFTLELGDTLGGLYGNTGLCAGGVFTVQSIDSVQVGGSFRRRINFSGTDPCQQTSIIEGMGSTNGLTACYATPNTFSILLMCFTVNGELLYMSPCGEPDLQACGEIPSTITDTSHNLGAVRPATPNPSTGLFHLSQAAEQIIVYNAQGKLLFRQHGNEVDLSGYPPGVYTAVVQKAHGRSAQRLVVVR